MKLPSADITSRTRDALQHASDSDDISSAGIDRKPVCDPQDVLDAGKPMFFPQTEGAASGISLPKRSFLVGEPIPDAIRISNDSSQE